ncbi:hypothetical protein FJZ21_01395 [Candidatus Pacearchaeota archaeon]|nr:hypothetical protein [Candidatus Pacearchaeota archaeon]
MRFIKAGFTGGFLGIVISIADIFVVSSIIERLSSIGLYIASSFGKVCINTTELQCTLQDKFTTIFATMIGNTIAYFIIFALISLAISLIIMWLTPSKKETIVQQAPQVIQVPAQPVQQPQQVVKVVEKRPAKKAKVKKIKR